MLLFFSSLVFAMMIMIYKYICVVVIIEVSCESEQQYCKLMANVNKPRDSHAHTITHF